MGKALYCLIIKYYRTYACTLANHARYSLVQVLFCGGLKQSINQINQRLYFTPNLLIAKLLISPKKINL